MVSGLVSTGQPGICQGGDAARHDQTCGAAVAAPPAACDPELAKTKLLAELDAAVAAASKVRSNAAAAAAAAAIRDHACTHLTCPHLLLPRQNHVQQKKTLTAAELQSAIDNIRGAVMICYPQGLPEWDMVRQCLEEREDLSGTNVSREAAARQGQLSNSACSWQQRALCNPWVAVAHEPPWSYPCGLWTC